MNEHFRTVIIAPITGRGREEYPTRYLIGNLSTEKIVAVKNIIKEMLVA
jgi:hypothetical protein